MVQNSHVDMIDLRSQLDEMLNVGPGFPSVAGIVEVDARGFKNSGMAELRRVIYETAMKMEFRHTRPAYVEKLIGRKVKFHYRNIQIMDCSEGISNFTNARTKSCVLFVL